MFGGSSQLSTNAEHRFVVWTVRNDLIAARSAVVGSWEEQPNIWLTVVKNPFVGWALNFRVWMLVKGALSLQTVNNSDIKPHENYLTSNFQTNAVFRPMLIYT